MNSKAIFTLWIIFFAASVAIATQTTYTFYSNGDTSINGEGSNNWNNNLGADPNMKIGHPPHIKHELIKFDINQILSTIGTSHVVSANLQLYIETNYNNWGSGTNVDALRLTNDWDEMTATWNCPSDSH